MIAEVQFGTRLLRSTLRDVPVSEVFIEQLDAAGDVPLRTVCWLTQEVPDEFENALANDWTVAESTKIIGTDHGYQYHITYSESYPGTDVYDAVVEQEGVFIAGHSSGEDWTLQVRFPDQSSLSRFRDTCQQVAVDCAIETVGREETIPQADRYDLSEPQREILTLASRQGYFEVPRKASLSDLSEDLGISSQAASERLRRGLNSLVEGIVLASE